MNDLWNQMLRLRGRPGAVTALGLGVAAVWLALFGIVGAILVSDPDDDADLATTGDDAAFNDILSGGSGDQVTTPVTNPDGSAAPVVTLPDGSSPTTVAGATPGATTTTVAGGQAPASTAPPATAAPTTAPPSGGGGDGLPAGGDATGVSASEIKIGVHAPETFSGAPLNLAEDPIKGIETYAQVINDAGGINGRKLTINIADDRFDSPGARNAANTLINDQKNFIVSGTLGIDQIAIVAAEAAKRGVPYMAAGGNEEKPIPGMFQISTSYTVHVRQLADYMAIDPKYAGKRVGILVSDSEFIRPVADQFKARLEQRGLSVSTIVANKKPADNPDYNGYILDFRTNNTEVVVPLTDPLTTQQIVQRCAAGAACGWTYAFSNFAHDSDTALALMTPTWQNQAVRGLSGACYYTAPQVNDRNKCASMSIARDQYVAARGQAAWDDEGSGAAAGYQLISFIKGALQRPGAELTRERFVASLRQYASYDDLITGPISFAGSGNSMVGASKMSVFESQSNNRYKMISDGLLAGF